MFRTSLVVLLLAGALAAAQPARPDCTGPVNDKWQNAPVPFATSAYSGTGPQTDTQWEATTVAGDYVNPVFSVMTGPTRLYNRSTGLASGTRYFWHARHKNAQGWSPFCVEEQLRFDDANPQPPGVPLVALVDAGTVSFTFTPGGDGESGVDDYSIHELGDAGALFSLNTTATSFTRRVGPGTYRWQVRTNDVAGNTSAASTSAVLTVPANLGLPVLDAPTVTPPASATTFDVSAPPDAGTALFVVARRFNQGASANVATLTGGTPLSQSPGTDGVWQWRIALLRTGGVGDWSEWSAPVIRDTGDPSTPGVPSIASPPGQAPVQLQWDGGADVGSGLAGFNVERRAVGGMFVVLQGISPGPERADDAPEGRWEYRVQGVDRAGNTSPRSPTSAVAVVDRTAPTSPAPVTATASALLAEVSWAASTDAVAGLADYLLERRGASESAWSAVTSTDQLGASVVLAPGRWVFRVTARDGVGHTVSAESNELNVQALALTESCSAGAECSSGACVHGHCCDLACATACDSTGRCPLVTMPKGCGCDASGPGLLLLATLLTLSPRRGEGRGEGAVERQKN